MRCLHCPEEIKYVQDMCDSDEYLYIRAKANRRAYYEDDIFCDFPKNKLVHVPLPLDRIDEVLYGRPKAN